MRKKLLCICLAMLTALGTLVPLGLAAGSAETFRTDPNIASRTQGGLALHQNGTVWAWGCNIAGYLDGVGDRVATPVQIQGLANVIKIEHSLALQSDGTVWSWGNSPLPQRVLNLNNVVAIAGNNRVNLALSGYGTVWAWSYDEWVSHLSASPEQVRHLDNVVAISGGGGWERSIALREDGTVWELLRDTREVVQKQGLSDIVAIASGPGHALALKEDGTVWAWGDNSSGQLGNGTSTGMGGDVMIVPVQVQNLTNVIAIDAGAQHSAAIRSDGTMWMWGRNAEGQLGDGTGGDSFILRTIPVQVQGLYNVTAMALGGLTTIALRSDGTVWSWGCNAMSSLGDGVNQSTSNISFRNVPARVVGPGGIGFLNLLQSMPEFGPNPLPFTDVTDANWFYPYVRHVADNNIMQGTTVTTFGPAANFSRAQVVATLYRMTHGGPASEFPYANNRAVFDDIAEDAWFAHYAAWAHDNDIVQGIGNNRFGGSQNVTREQLSTMLYRFATFREHSDLAFTGEQWQYFTDRGQISDWANDAMRWANFHGLITGRTATTIVPTGTAQRSEAAAILTRFMLAFGE